jgi:cell division protein FtsN
MKGYYPEYYLRKRQREQGYRKFLFVLGTVAFLALGIGCGYIIFSNVIQTRRSAPGATASLAEQKQQLELNEKLKENENKPSTEGLVADNSANQGLDLSTNEYAQSFPLVQVSVDGSGMLAGQTATDASQTTPSDASPTDGAAGATPADSAADTSNSSQIIPAAPGAPGATPGGTPSQVAQPPANTADKKTPAEKKPDEKASKPQDKPKKEEEKKPAPAVKPEEKKPEDSSRNNTGSGKKVYRVYAGLCTTREDADKLKEKASASGVSASVVKNGGDYLLLVSTVGSGDDAFALRDKLKGSGFNGAFVTQATQKVD